MLTTNWLVTTLSDAPSHTGLSLRDAITDAAASTGDDVITFDPSLFNGQLQQINLSGALTFGNATNPIHGDITIDGPGANQLAVNANGASNIIAFAYNGGQTYNLTLENIELTAASSAAVSIPGIPGLTSLTLNQIEISGNGEAISLTGSEYLTVNNSTIANNHTGNNPAVNLANSSHVSFTNDTISGNQSTGSTAGLTISSGSATLNDVTIANNQADINNTSGSSTAVGGIYAGSNGTITLNNSIVAGNLAGATGYTVNSDVKAMPQTVQFGPHGTLTGSYNLIGYDPDLTNGINNGSNGNQVGGENGAAVIDADLAPLDDYGGGIPTQMPLPGSTAIDEGSNALLAGLLTDERGLDRVFNSTVDIGAVETTGDDPPVNTTSEMDGIGIVTLNDALTSAIESLTSSNSPVQITFMQGLTGTIDTTGFSLGSYGHPLEGSLTIDGSGASIRIDGQGHASSIFSVSWNNSFDLAINDLTLENATGPAISVGNVGVAQLSLNQVTITGSGGGLFFDADNGGVELNINNSTISNNSGDGIDAENGALVTVFSSTISGNAGVGVSLYLSSGTFTNDTISDNYTTGSVGGFEESYGGATLTDCMVRGNQADSGNTSGESTATGGVYAGANCTITLNGCAVFGNIAGAVNNSVPVDLGLYVYPNYPAVNGHIVGSDNFIGSQPPPGSGIQNGQNGNTTGGVNSAIKYGPYFNFTAPLPGEGIDQNWQVARDGNGDTLIAYDSNVAPHDLTYTVISADGVVGPLVSTHLFNSYAGNDFSIAMNASGEFVIAYGFQQHAGGGAAVNIYQIIGGSTPLTYEQTIPLPAVSSSLDSIALDPSGDFVVVWGGNQIINAQAFRHGSNTLSNVFQVNTTTGQSADNVSVDIQSNGQFDIFWAVSIADQGIPYLSRFNNDFFQGTTSVPSPISPGDLALSVNSGFSSAAWSVAMDATGDFVLVWLDSGADDNGNNTNDITFELFNPEGTPTVGPVNTGNYAPGGINLMFNAVAMDANGDFVITWENTDGSISAQAFRNTGAAVGGSFPVFTTTDTAPGGLQTIAMGPNGDFVIISDGGVTSNPGGSPFNRILQGQEFESPF